MNTTTLRLFLVLLLVVLCACSRQTVTDTEGVSFAPTALSGSNWSREGNFPKRLFEAQAIGTTTIEGGKAVSRLYVFGGFEATCSSSNGLPLVPTREAYSINMQSTRNSAAAWRDIADLGAGLTHAGIAVLGSKIYLAGGIEGNFTGSAQGRFGRVINRVFAYDAATNSYIDTQLPDLRFARAAGGLAVVNRGTASSPDWELHYFGGFDPSGNDNVFVHEMLQLDPNGNSVGGWQSVNAAFPSNRTRNHFGVAVAYDNSKPYLFMIGGQEGYTDVGREFSNDSINYYVDRYDVRANVWQSVRNLPVPLNHIGSSTIVGKNTKIWVLGGSTSTGQGQFSNRVFSYNSENGTTGPWTNEGLLPARRSSLVAGADAYNGDLTRGFFVISTGRSGSRESGEPSCGLFGHNQTWSSSVVQ